MTESKPKYWGKLIAEQEAGKHKIGRFCRERGISEPSFYYWRNRLRQSTPVRFALLQTAPTAPSRPACTLELVLRNGDAKGVIQIFNVGAERMLGYTAADVMNKITPADISDPQELIARAQALSMELETPITPGFEALVFKASRGIEDIYALTYIRKNGSRFPAVVSVTALRDVQNVIIDYLLIGTDNTARLQVEEERRKLDQRLRDQHFYTRSLIESNIDALITTDPRGMVPLRKLWGVGLVVWNGAHHPV